MNHAFSRERHPGGEKFMAGVGRRLHLKKPCISGIILAPSTLGYVDLLHGEPCQGEGVDWRFLPRPAASDRPPTMRVGAHRVGTHRVGAHPSPSAPCLPLKVRARIEASSAYRGSKRLPFPIPKRSVALSAGSHSPEVDIVDADAGAVQSLAGGADRRACSSVSNTTNEKPWPSTGSSQ